MKTIFHFLLLFLLIVSCDRNTENFKLNEINKQNYSEEKIYIEANFKKAYDIVELKSLKDTSKFIARLTFNRPFISECFFEVNEITNGINLCIKQPIQGYYPTDENYERSLDFNQLCYWYADNDAFKIKKAFLNFESGLVQNDYLCKNCFDNLKFQVEIYNHGKYSSIIKDYLTKNDSAFITFIASMVKLTSKNDFIIQY